jgi:hypothetical protein
MLLYLDFCSANLINLSRGTAGCGNEILLFIAPKTKFCLFKDLFIAHKDELI